MTRTIDAQQQEFTTRSHLAPLLLVVLTTYTDRAAETVDTVFYFSDRSVIYDYGNTGADRYFWPLLKSISPLRTSIDHVPDPRASELLSKPLAITLSNESHQGDRLINTLRDGHTLENATIEVSQILQERQPKPPVDLTALDGDEHTVLYRGAVERIATITDEEIVLQCILDLPSMEWLIANDATITDPRDVGARLPIIYGQAKRVPAIGYVVGWATTLAETITDTATGNTEFTDLTGVTGAGIAIRLGNEEITVTKVSDTVGNITARAQNSTVAVAHNRGEITLELVSMLTFVVAGHAVDAIDDIYIRHPVNGELIRVDTGFTKTIANTTLISGETVATVAITAAQLKTIFDETFSDIESIATNPVVNITPNGREAVDVGGTVVDFQQQLNSASSPRAEGTDGAGTRTKLRLWFPIGSIPDSGRTVVRARIRIQGNVKSTDARAVRGEIDDLGGDFPGFSANDEAQMTAASNTEVFGLLAHGPWRTPPADTTLADYETNTPATAGQPDLRFRVLEASGTPAFPKSDEYAELTGDWGIQFELEPPGSVELKGASIGPGLQIFADVSGYLSGVGHQPATTPISIGLLIGNDISNYRRYDLGSQALTAGVWTRIEVDIQSPDSTTGTPNMAAVDFFRFAATAGADGGEKYWLDSIASVNGGDVVFLDCDNDAANWSSLLDCALSDSAAQFAPGSSGSLEILTDAPLPGDDYRMDREGFTPVDLSADDFAFYILVDGGDPTFDPHPANIIQHWIEEIGDGTIDATSFASAVTNLGSDEWALDARTLGFTWPEIAARMQHAARSNLIPEETASGTEWKLLQAETDYEWPAASGSITEWESFVEAGRDLRELATRYHFPYAYDASLGIDEAAFTAVVVATPDQSDVSVTTGQLATAEATFGRRDAEPVALPTILEEATAEEIAGYYVHEGIRLAAIFVISGVPWWQAYAVEVGDLLDVTPPWASSSVKVRVIEYVKDFGTEQIEIRCVEVA